MKKIIYNGKRILAYHKGEKMFWFRIYGIGFSFRNVNRWPLSFGERLGYSKYLRVFNYIIEFLPKENINER